MTDWRQWLHHRGISEESIARFHLDYDADRNAIRIPYLDAAGDLQQIRWRRLGDGHPKYQSGAGMKASLYNVADAAGSPVYICEGEMDVITLTQQGLLAVGVPGASSFQPPWKWLFLGAQVHVMFDGDEAGKKGAYAVARHLNHVAAEVIVHDLPDGEDVNSLMLSGSLEEVLT